mmetsp:Transcript_63381/g.139471  ORF Transcript_63381/g.139471 Transcript_63381/m.139471 type:complete len:206 (-) Transcript_63381:337-954(-)
MLRRVQTLSRRVTVSWRWRAITCARRKRWLKRPTTAPAKFNASARFQCCEERATTAWAQVPWLSTRAPLPRVIVAQAQVMSMSSPTAEALHMETLAPLRLVKKAVTRIVGMASEQIMAMLRQVPQGPILAMVGRIGQVVTGSPGNLSQLLMIRLVARTMWTQHMATMALSPTRAVRMPVRHLTLIHDVNVHHQCLDQKGAIKTWS